MNEYGLQSALHPAAGSGAALLHQLGWVLYVGAAAIFLLVMALLALAVFRRARRASARVFIVGGGIAFPVFTLTLLLSYSLAVGEALRTTGGGGPLQLLLDCFSSLKALRSPPPSTPALRIEIVGKQWWWEVRYLQPNGAHVIAANELRIPTGEPVMLELASSDVIHSFWAPTLAGKVDMIPGRRNRLTLRTDQPGVYRGQCAEYCGGQHALMAFYVVAQPADEFRAWLQHEAQPAREPQDEFLRLGRDMFFRGECHDCHTVRGTPARGGDGPDLTHFGNRRSIAAGALRNHTGALAGWIANAQDIKHGAAMPASNVYTGYELRALTAWLESLE